MAQANNSDRAETDALKSRVRLVSIFEAHGVQIGIDEMAHCPWHEDPTPSLHIDDFNGFFKCFGCDAKGDHLEALKLFEGLDFPAALQRLREMNGGSSPQHERGKKPERIKPVFPIQDCEGTKLNEKLASGKTKINESWIPIREHYGEAVKGWKWRDKDGGWIYATVRHEKPDGKSVLPYYFGVDGKWHQGNPLKSGRPLLRLPELLKSTERVLIVEGERCADVPVPGFIVTTWTGGAKAVSQTDWTTLESRDVTVWPDSDADEVARISHTFN